MMTSRDPFFRATPFALTSFLVCMAAFGLAVEVRGASISFSQDSTSYINPGSGSVLVNGTGVNSLTVPSDTTFTNDAQVAVGSFFYRWSGDEVTPQNRFSDPLIISAASNETFNLTYLFSGEAFPGALYGDLDGDTLADRWEDVFGLDATSAGSPNGTAGNPDGDFIPSNVNATNAWPLTGLRLESGYNTGPYFNNALEFLGLDGTNTNPTNFGPFAANRGDDPRTSPQENDSDGDDMPDGWEYYFWRWRGAGATNFPNGTNVSGNAFDPVRSGDPTGDADGDGLSNGDEFTWGTDPTHFDTDRDGMDDKWELDNALNPLDPSDEGSNNDGDAMAQETIIRTIGGVTTTTILYHASVYLAGALSMEGGDTAFDPTTAWRGGTGSHNNTVDLTAFDEYLGADRIPRVQANADGVVTNTFDPSDDTDPNNADTDSDGIQDGWEDYVGLNPKSNGDAGGDPDLDGLDNSTEWANTTATNSNNSGVLGSWTNKIWPTDPGILTRPFAWQNVWYDSNGNGMYESNEFSLFTGGVYPGNPNKLSGHSAGWTTPTTTLGRVNPYVPSVVNGISDRPIQCYFTGLPNVWVDGLSGMDGIFDADDIVIRGAPPLGATGTQDRLLFYHNDPHPRDTDWDGLPDSTPLGGGEKGQSSNPTAVDTDDDFLPDGWEVYAYKSGAPTNGGIHVKDTTADHDGDGLVNNLEYWTGSVIEWMHIDWKWIDYPGRIATRRSMRWDLGGDGIGGTFRGDMPYFIGPDFVTDPSFSVANNQRADTARDFRYYHTTRADDADTDLDGMDDFWEVYHGLNPTKGSRDLMVDPDLLSNGTRIPGTGNDAADFDAVPSTVGYFETGITNDFGSCSNMITSLLAGEASLHVGPFNFGLELMDPDADGLANIDEYSFELTATQSVRKLHHTDPTPFLRTSRYLAPSSNNNLFVLSSYTFDNLADGTVPGFKSTLGWASDAGFPFAFETVEGLDTDNDLIGDDQEIVAPSVPGGTGGTDPQNALDPIRNRALKLNSASGDFMRSFNAWASGTANQLTRFTVEAWVRPATISPANEVIVEKSHVYSGTFGYRVLANFRLGITNNGRPYVAYNNTAGDTAPAVGAQQFALAANQWAHLAGVFDGTNLTLYVNGVFAGSTPSVGLPVNGYNIDPVNFARIGTITIGARDGVLTPYGFTANDSLFDAVNAFGANYALGVTNFYNGYVDEVRVWEGARSQAEVQASMNKKVSRTEAGAHSTLEHYFTFDDCPDVDVNWTVNGVTVPDEPIVPAEMETLQGPTLPVHQPISQWAIFSQRSTVYTGSAGAPYNYIVFAEDHVAHKAVVPPTDDLFHDSTDANNATVMPFGYPNTANPYERRSNLVRLNIDRPMLDLLFCNGAQVDGDIFVSDSWLPGLSGNPESTDTDGDGLADYWEIFYGLNPFVATGDDGAWGDVDRDGLNNLAEFQAGTDPRDFDTDGDGFSDFDGTNAVGQTFGDLYADGDGMDDDWETEFPGALSPQKFDAFDDPDGDGWSNFAEFMFNGPSGTGTTCRTNPTDAGSRPTPNVGFLVKYKGTTRTGNLVIRAYNHPSMNYNPTAELMSSPPSFVSQFNLTTSQFAGGLREGDTWFFAFLDNNGDGSWSVGEPAGLGQNQPYKVSFGDLTNVVIGLTDTLPGYARFRWPATASQVYTVVITRTTSAGAPIMLSRSPLISRNYFNEGDYRYAGVFGIDAGESDLPGYQWFVGSNTGSFAFNWSTALSKPLLNSPNGAPLLFAQSVFAWQMDDNSVNVRLQILAGSPTGSVVYDNAKIPAPYKDADSLYRFTLPLYVGDRSLPNGTYFWRVQSFNPRKQSAFSDFASFTVNTSNSVPDVYSIAGTIDYFGRVTKGNVIVQAFRSPGCGGSPAGQITLVDATAGAYRISGLPAGTYYLRAFLDQNKNGTLDNFESQGTIPDVANTSCAFGTKPHILPASQTAQDIVLRDRDANNDNISDAFAYQFLSKQFQRADFDGDSIGDLSVYFAGNGTWYTRKSSDLSLQQTQFGWSAAVPVPGDYDADGVRDIAVYHPASATWYLSRSSAGFQQRQFGWSAVIPVPGDYDGDGQRDIAVFDPGSGTWYILQSSTLSVRIQQFGFGGVTPVPGDYDGDGKADLAVYHQPSGNWFILHSSSQQLLIHNWGWIAAKPVPCDYDGDGKTDLAVYNQSAGDWYIAYTAGGTSIQNWGWSQARPVPADYEDDGRADIAVYHPQSGTWYIRYSSGGSATIPWGWNEAVPVSSDAALLNGRTP
ncbi:MAG: LamG-like jellyroll fold domain-containing protein [bacterium]